MDENTRDFPCRHISTADAPTFGDVLEMIKKVEKGFPPPPTKEQLKWAMDNGFPGWPGFKLGVDAYADLKTLIKQKDIMRPPEILPSMCGTPFRVDESIDPGAVLCAEVEWMKTHVLVGARNVKTK